MHPAPPSIQWENVYQHLNSINATVKLFQLETAVRMAETLAGACIECVVLGVLTFVAPPVHLHCRQTTADKQTGLLCQCLTAVLMPGSMVSARGSEGKPPAQTLKLSHTP